MGIKFNCPNGHKLNVKSFLAGKKGICPDCGEKFIIPHESGGTVDSYKRGGEAVKIASTASPGTGSVAAAPAAQAASPAGPSTQPTSATAAAPISAAPAPQPAARAPQSDPIAEAPGASWYVRPPAGGQYGPAAGEVFRQWLSEGRVSAESLVWRDGWPDWRRADTVFSQLGASGGQPASSIPMGTPAPANAPMEQSEMGTTSPPRSRHYARKKASNQMTAVVVVFLAIAAIALIAVFIWVLNRQQSPSSDDSSTSAIDTPAAIVCYTDPSASADLVRLSPNTITKDSHHETC